MGNNTPKPVVNAPHEETNQTPPMKPEAETNAGKHDAETAHADKATSGTGIGQKSASTSDKYKVVEINKGKRYAVVATLSPSEWLREYSNDLGHADPKEAAESYCLKLNSKA